MKAKAQKKQAIAEKQAAADKLKREAEDRDWQKGSNQRRQQKEKAALEKQNAREQNRAAKEEARRQDEEMISKMRKPRGKARKAEKAKKKKALNGMGVFALQLKHDAAKKKSEKSQAAAAAATKNMRSVDMLEVRNTNKEEELNLEASGIDGALSVLDLATKTAASDDRHPEKRIKAAFKAFEEAQMAVMREEFPSLKRSQLKDRIWKKWQKSPQNPMNQKAD